jgi:hypothetical protein
MEMKIRGSSRHQFAGARIAILRRILVRVSMGHRCAGGKHGQIIFQRQDDKIAGTYAKGR